MHSNLNTGLCLFFQAGQRGTGDRTCRQSSLFAEIRGRVVDTLSLVCSRSPEECSAVMDAVVHLQTQTQFIAGMEPVFRSSLRSYVSALSAENASRSGRQVKLLRRAPTYIIQAGANKEARICRITLAAVSLLFQRSSGRETELEKYRQHISRKLYLRRVLLFDEYDSNSLTYLDDVDIVVVHYGASSTRTFDQGCRSIGCRRSAVSVSDKHIFPFS